MTSGAKAVGAAPADLSCFESLTVGLKPGALIRAAPAHEGKPDIRKGALQAPNSVYQPVRPFRVLGRVEYHGGAPAALLASVDHRTWKEPQKNGKTHYGEQPMSQLTRECRVNPGGHPREKPKTHVGT